MTYRQNIENLLITHFIKSSHIFEDSDSDDSKDSDEEQFDAEDDEVISSWIMFFIRFSLFRITYLQ